MNDLLEKFRQQAFNLAMSTVPDFPFGIEDCIMKYAPGYYSWEWGKKTWFFNITWWQDMKLLALHYANCETKEKLDLEKEVDLLKGEQI